MSFKGLKQGSFVHRKDDYPDTMPWITISHTVVVILTSDSPLGTVEVTGTMLSPDGGRHLAGTNTITMNDIGKHYIWWDMLQFDTNIDGVWWLSVEAGGRELTRTPYYIYYPAEPQA